MFGISSFKFFFWVFVFAVYGLEFWCLGFFLCFGFGVWSFWIMILSLGFRVCSFGFEVWSFEFWS